MVVGIIGFILVVVIIIGIFLLFAPVFAPDCPAGLDRIDCGDPPDGNAI